jgi:hypothetical protein
MDIWTYHDEIGALISKDWAFGFDRKYDIYQKDAEVFIQLVPHGVDALDNEAFTLYGIGKQPGWLLKFASKRSEFQLKGFLGKWHETKEIA